MRFFRFFLPACLVFMLACLFHQPVYSQHRTHQLVETTAPITIDGTDKEEAWSTAQAADLFINHWPVDTGLAVSQTDVRMLYDSRNLYLFAKVMTGTKKLVVQSLKRDVNPYYSDGISIVIDPTGSAISGYTFGVNSAGAQFDGIVNNNDVSFDWDTRWYSAVKKYDDHWTAEFSIPLKAMRFAIAKKSWRINFVRNDMTNNSFSTWNRAPIQFHGANLGCLGEAFFTGNNIKKPARLPVFIPYINTTMESIPGTKTDYSFKAGMDMKVPVASSMNLDVTINPDFSQVDVDQQVINLNRYSILLPEKRIFFLENSDLFNTLGTPTIRPFVSRTIGLDNNGKTVPLAGGLRLTGFLNPSLRIGVMDMQSGKIDSNRRQNYFVAVAEQRILKRSDIKLFFMNAEDMYSGPVHKSAGTGYNRVAGAEFNYLKADGSLTFGIKSAKSINPGDPSRSFYYNTYFAVRNSRRLLSINLNSVGKNFISSMGYTPRLYNYDVLNDTTFRLGYYHVDGYAQFDFYPANKKKVNMTFIAFSPNLYWFSNGHFSEASGDLSYNILTADRRSFRFGFIQSIVSLPFETSIFSSLDNLKAGDYSYGVGELAYESNFLKPFSWNMNLQAGGYYDGKRISVTGGVKKRIQPWLNLAANISYNHIDLHGKTLFPVIISPSIEVAANNKMFFTTFMQYNSLADNFNVNARFNWRFSPMSDIYLVFNSNYLTPDYKRMGSSLTFKLSYWIN